MGVIDNRMSSYFTKGCHLKLLMLSKELWYCAFHNHLFVFISGIIQNSGSRSVADYAVVPILGCQVESTVNEITTNCWLQMCIEMEQCLEPSSNSIFNPIFLVQDALPLQGCVVSIRLVQRSGQCLSL